MTQLFSKARVCVVGDVMLDRYWHGEATRISPEAPVPVVRVQLDEARPGGAANVALNVAALGARAFCGGLVGRDAEADRLTEVLATHAVSTRLLACQQPTITKLRVMSQSHQMIRLDFEQPFDPADALALLDVCPLDDCDALVLSDYAKGSLACPAWIAAARARQLPVIVDPKGSDFSKYRGATVVTPNLHEFEAVVGVVANDEALVAAGRRLIAELDWTALLVTRSEQGMTLIGADGSVVHLAATAREVADVTGAGDTVVATLATALAQGLPLADAARLANRAAGIVVSKLGTASVSVRELFAEDPESGVFVSREALQRWVEAARGRGERVVMTNGCFDILHAGHVSYLREAASLGDRLIVAVNDDASVQRLKGPTRPLNRLARRLDVLAGLGAVDAVIGFSEDTPEALIDLLQPDVLVKGGDYASVEDVVGHERVLAYGGEVKVLGEVANLSTSRLIERIRQADSDSTN